MQTIDSDHFFFSVVSLLSCLVFSTWMATCSSSSSLTLHHRCWSRLDLPWRPPRLMLNFHSVSATTTVAAASLAVKAPFERCSSGRIGIRTCSRKSKWIIRRCSTNPFVVVDDEKYGNKQVVSVTPSLYEYILGNVREPEVVNLFPIFSNKIFY